MEQENKEIKQRGRPKTKTSYDTKQYYLTFKEKNKDKIHEIQQCIVCGGKFSYYNLSHHKSSKKHQKAQNTNLIEENQEKKDETNNDNN